MRIILLLEREVRLPDGLQGDLEYIEFERGHPEKSFGKILEMISSLNPIVIDQATPLTAPMPSTTVTPGRDGLSEFVDRYDQPAYLWDASHVLIHCNDSLCELINISRADLVGKKYEVINEYFKARVHLADRAAFSTRQEGYNREFSRKDAPARHLVDNTVFDNRDVGRGRFARQVCNLTIFATNLGNAGVICLTAVSKTARSAINRLESTVHDVASAPGAQRAYL